MRGKQRGDGRCALERYGLFGLPRQQRRLEGTFLMIKSEKNIILAALTVMQDY